MEWYPLIYGPVIVGGNFTVVGGAKSAAVPHPDGSHRRLYCMESPESWFEDFGEGALVCGEASIALDADFAAVVDASKYHVFLTAHRSHADLALTERSPDGFRVRASEGAEGTFSWRVVAKRKDIAAPRFEPVELPKEPALPPVPDSVYQEAPKPPDLHRAMAAASWAMCQVLHDWPDAECRASLSRCRKAMRETDPLLVIEMQHRRSDPCDRETTTCLTGHRWRSTWTGRGANRRSRSVELLIRRFSQSFLLGADHVDHAVCD